MNRVHFSEPKELQEQQIDYKNLDFKAAQIRPIQNRSQLFQLLKEKEGQNPSKQTYKESKKSMRDIHEEEENQLITGQLKKLDQKREGGGGVIGEAKIIEPIDYECGGGGKHVGATQQENLLSKGLIEQRIANNNKVVGSCMADFSQNKQANQDMISKQSLIPHDVIHCHVCLLGKFLIVKHTATQELNWIDIELWEIYYEEADDVFTNQHSMLAAAKPQLSGMGCVDYSQFLVPLAAVVAGMTSVNQENSNLNNNCSSCGYNNNCSQTPCKPYLENEEVAVVINGTTSRNQPIFYNAISGQQHANGLKENNEQLQNNHTKYQNQNENQLEMQCNKKGITDSNYACEQKFRDGETANAAIEVYATSLSKQQEQIPPSETVNKSSMHQNVGKSNDYNQQIAQRAIHLEKQQLGGENQIRRRGQASCNQYDGAAEVDFTRNNHVADQAALFPYCQAPCKEQENIVQGEKRSQCNNADDDKFHTMQNDLACQNQAVAYLESEKVNHQLNGAYGGQSLANNHFSRQDQHGVLLYKSESKRKNSDDQSNKSDERHEDSSNRRGKSQTANRDHIKKSVADDGELKQPTLASNAGGIEIMFSTIEDFLIFTEEAKQLCLICLPRIDEVLTFEKNIGKGSQASIDIYSSRIKQGLQDESTKYAVKSYLFKDETSSQYSAGEYAKVLRAVQAEIRFLRELQMCDNIITLECVYKCEDKYQLVLRFAEYGCLRSYIISQGTMPERNIKQVMEQLLLAIDFMHRKEIIHRDIKPENILVLDKDQLQVCFADLGLACRLTDQKHLILKCGTPGYVDPDVLRGRRFSEKSDIFSLGSLLFNMVSGRLLFSGKTAKEILHNNRNINPQNYIDKTCQQVSKKCRDLLKLMVTPTQEHRPTAEECLRHPFFEQDQELLNELLEMNRSGLLNNYGGGGGGAGGTLFASKQFLGSISNIQNLLNMQMQLESQFASFIMGPDYFFNQQQHQQMHQHALIQQQQQCLVPNSGLQLGGAISGAGANGGLGLVSGFAAQAHHAQSGVGLGQAPSNFMVHQDMSLLHQAHLGQAVRSQIQHGANDIKYQGGSSSLHVSKMAQMMSHAAAAKRDAAAFLMLKQSQLNGSKHLNAPSLSGIQHLNFPLPLGGPGGGCGVIKQKSGVTIGGGGAQVMRSSSKQRFHFDYNSLIRNAQQTQGASGRNGNMKNTRSLSHFMGNYNNLASMMAVANTAANQKNGGASRRMHAPTPTSGADSKERNPIILSSQKAENAQLRGYGLNDRHEDLSLHVEEDDDSQGYPDQQNDNSRGQRPASQFAQGFQQRGRGNFFPVNEHTAAFNSQQNQVNEQHVEANNGAGTTQPHQRKPSQELKVGIVVTPKNVAQRMLALQNPDYHNDTINEENKEESNAFIGAQNSKMRQPENKINCSPGECQHKNLADSVPQFNSDDFEEFLDEIKMPQYEIHKMDRTKLILFVPQDEEERKNAGSGPEDIDEGDELDFDEGLDVMNAVPEDDLADGGVGEISRVDPRDFPLAMTTNLIYNNQKNQMKAGGGLAQSHFPPSNYNLASVFDQTAGRFGGKGGAGHGGGGGHGLNHREYLNSELDINANENKQLSKNFNIGGALHRNLNQRNQIENASQGIQMQGRFNNINSSKYARNQHSAIPQMGQQSVAGSVSREFSAFNRGAAKMLNKNNTAILREFLDE